MLAGAYCFVFRGLSIVLVVMLADVTGRIISLEILDLLARCFERTTARITRCQCYQIVSKNRKVLYVLQHIFARIQHFGQWSFWRRYQKLCLILVNATNVRH